MRKLITFLGSVHIFILFLIFTSSNFTGSNCCGNYWKKKHFFIFGLHKLNHYLQSLNSGTLFTLWHNFKQTNFLTSFFSGGAIRTDLDYCFFWTDLPFRLFLPLRLKSQWRRKIKILSVVQSGIPSPALKCQDLFYFLLSNGSQNKSEYTLFIHYVTQRGKERGLLWCFTRV
jgi:hypothetical protein